MRKEKKWWKKFSAYQIVAFILTILFVVGIIITIGVLVGLKDKIDDTKKKNEELEESLQEETANSSSLWQNIYEKEIIDFKI